MRRHLLLGVAALTCPCHVPLVAVLLAGTALGGFITDNLLLLFGAFGLLFGGALWIWSHQPVEVPSGETPATVALSASSSPVGDAQPLRVQLLKTPGCASCAGVERSWEMLQPAYGDRVRVEVIDLLERPEAAQHYRVLRSPAVVIDGRLRAQGALDAGRLRRLLDEALRDRDGGAQATAERARA